MKVQPADRTNRIQEYYFSGKLNQIREMNSNGMDIINLGIGNPDLAPPSAVVETLVDSCKEDNAHGYQSYKGIPELRSGFTQWYQSRFNISLSPDSEVLPLIGSKEGIMHISMAFINKGDGVLIPDPGYPAYEAAVRICGGRCIYYNLLEENSWLPDLDSFEKEDLRGVKMMWINYPNMPTGKPASAEVFQKLVDFAFEHDILLINDNPYSFILNENPVSVFSARGAMDIALELNSLSKSHNMAGWRIGMVAGNEEYINYILRVKSNMDSGMFLPVQLAAVKALEADDKWYDDLNNAYLKRREIVYLLLEELSCKYDPNQSGMFVWAEIPDNWSGSYQFTDYMLDNFRLFITPGSIFGANGRKYIRVSLCVKEKRLEESILRVKN